MKTNSLNKRLGVFVTDKVDDRSNNIFISEFSLKEVVYLKTDPEQKPRIVTSISFKGSGAVTYSLGCGIEDTDHYDFEITKEEDILKKC